MVKINTCIFISGRGSNLRSIIKSAKNYRFPIKIALIISNNSKALGIKYAKKYNIPFKFFSSKNIRKFERNSLNELKKKKIKFLCLAGFMKVLSSDFIRLFKHKIINIHPSLLPKFKGLNTFERVLKAKEKFTGCTVHFVDEKLDNGKIIIKKRIGIKENYNKELLKNRVQVEEYKAYSEALRKIYKSN